MAFAPVFQSPFSGPFDRHAAVAAPPAVQWWPVAGKTCVAAYQPIGAASLAASYANLHNPGTYDAAPGVAPGLGALGWTWNGIDQYLTPDLIPGTDWTVLISVAGCVDGLKIPTGMADDAGDTGVFYIIPANGGVNVQYAKGAAWTNATNAPKAISGVLCIAGLACYRDGVAESFTIPGAPGTYTIPLFLGALNYNGTATYFFEGTIAAAVFYSDTLTADEVATVSAAMAAL